MTLESREQSAVSLVDVHSHLLQLIHGIDRVVQNTAEANMRMICFKITLPFHNDTRNVFTSPVIVLNSVKHINGNI